MKLTKIVCTIGPATESPAMLEKMMLAGMNVARLNTSHGSKDEHMMRIKNIKEASRKTGKPTGILLDLAGPKIRLGDLETPLVNLVEGKTIILTTDKVVGNTKKISVNYGKLPQELKKGSIVMLDDGKKKLVVQKISGNDITCKIIVGGDIKPRRGVNIPNGYLSIKSLTSTDRDVLEHFHKSGVDFVALSFVRTVSDILDLKKVLAKLKWNPGIIAKIETQEALNHIDEILDHVDGVMVARGDLAIETPREYVPVEQKNLISKCISKGKISIVATQMVESMIHERYPTRAEVSDIANAIFEGTDAIMTSEETSLGKYPVETVETMADVARHVEGSFKPTIRFEYNPQHKISHAIARHAQQLADTLDTHCIVVLTESGRTAREIAQFRGNKPIYALTPSRTTIEQLSLVRGVYPLSYTPTKPIEEVRPEIVALIKSQEHKKTQTMVIVSGSTMRKLGATNMIIVEQ